MRPEESVTELSPDEVHRLLRERRILLVDVREPDEFAAGRIAGALLCPLSTLDAACLPIDGSRHVVFQCGSGKRSLSAARAYLEAGAPRASHLAGGIAAWTAERLPVICKE
jgi:rhodanese-related sulfurtransferase